MPDEILNGPNEEDAAFEQQLADLGPVMRRQAQSEARGPDPAFVNRLRAQLVGEQSAARADAYRALSALEQPVHSASHRRARSPVVAAGVAIAALAAVLVFARVVPYMSHSRTNVVFALPTPGPSDLIRVYPLNGGVGGGGSAEPPWLVTAEIPAGASYRGRLRLTSGPLRFGLAQVSGYQLVAPSHEEQRLRRAMQALGMTGPIKHHTRSDGTWIYAVEAHRNAATTPEPQYAQNEEQSIAISLRTGEVVYHGSNLGPSPVMLALNDAGNVKRARSWMRRLGLGMHPLPLHAAASSQEAHFINTVTLGWRGISSSNVPQAQVVFAANRQIIDAHIWPPVARAESVSARGYAHAWPAIRDGKAPIGVANIVGPPPLPGSGQLGHIGVVQILTGDPAGHEYLVPAYRFEGPVTIHGLPNAHTWFAIVPAARSVAR